MEWGFGFFFGSALLGVGLAMDACSVSIANGLHEPDMTPRRLCMIAGIYAAFQAVMPLTGWFLVRAAAEQFQWFRQWIPWIGGGLLLWIGGKMLWEGLSGPAEDGPAALGITDLLLQGVATSIDALSAGFAFAEYRAGQALAAAGIIAAVTFCVCAAGLRAGIHFGLRLAERASVAGGLILLGIGLSMLLRGGL